MSIAYLKNLEKTDVYFSNMNLGKVKNVESCLRHIYIKSLYLPTHLKLCCFGIESIDLLLVFFYIFLKRSVKSDRANISTNKLLHRIKSFYSKLFVRNFLFLV